MLACIVQLFMLLQLMRESRSDEVSLPVEHSEQQSLFQGLLPLLLTNQEPSSSSVPPSTQQQWPPPSKDCPPPEPPIATSVHRQSHDSHQTQSFDQNPEHGAAIAPDSNSSAAQNELQKQQHQHTLDAEPAPLSGRMSRSSFPHTFDLSAPELETDARTRLRSDLLDACALPLRARRVRLLGATLPFCAHVPLLVALPRSESPAQRTASTAADAIGPELMNGSALFRVTPAAGTGSETGVASSAIAAPAAGQVLSPAAQVARAGAEASNGLECVLEAAAERCRECVSSVLARDAEAGAAGRAFARALEFYSANAGPLGCANERAELNEWSNGRHTCSDCTVCLCESVP